MRYHIILAGSHGGTLDQRTVEAEGEAEIKAEIKAAVQDIVLNCELEPGDTISIAEAE